MKGIILAGGKGTRLYPTTRVVSKQLLPIYDKPSIYYPIDVMIQSNIVDILIISNPEHIPQYQTLLGDGSQLGISISYQSQAVPRGLPEAFILGDWFIGDDDVMLMLGDNVFCVNNISTMVDKAMETHRGATIFGTKVPDPERSGVVEFDPDTNEVISLEEKPEQPKSDYAITGMYIFDSTVSDRAKKLKPSKRGELEIIDLQKSYLEEGKLNFVKLPEGSKWFDTGTPASLLEASQYIKELQENSNTLIGCLEVSSFKSYNISLVRLRELAKKMPISVYKHYVDNYIEKWVH